MQDKCRVIVLHMKHLFQLFELDVLLGNMHVAFQGTAKSSQWYKFTNLLSPAQVCVWGLAQMETGMLKQ